MLNDQEALKRLQRLPSSDEGGSLDLTDSDLRFCFENKQLRIDCNITFVTSEGK